MFRWKVFTVNNRHRLLCNKLQDSEKLERGC